MDSTPPQTPEKPYTATPTTYTGTTVTITATATFDRFLDGAGGLSTLSSGVPNGTLTVNPIRHAEFHIYDAAGIRIQQGETDAYGQISAIIPRLAGTYSLWVNSRADNSYYRASVLDNPYDQNFYSLKTPFTLNGSETTSAVTITPAPADNTSSVLGGAFSILDQVLVANEFLRAKGNSGACSFCSNDFTTAPKVPIYWTKGLSPGAYFGAASTPISFYTNESGGGIYAGIYILGGVNDSICTDTDHFDRSVILHEYGHFLESAFSRTASPGGSHNGNSVIDPRLAWSEGWANFFQAMALGRTVYRDTVRNSQCTSGASLAFNDFLMETKASNDVPVSGSNEGVFREISISRTLYDNATGASQGSDYNLSNNTDARATDVGFSVVWHAFKLLGTSPYRFQNAGIFNEIFAGLVSSHYPGQAAANNSVLAFEEQIANQSLYGLQLRPEASACSFSILGTGVTAPTTEDIENGLIIYSDYLRNNDFYRYDYDGNPSNAILTLRYQHTSGTAPHDLDLYVYREKHVHLEPEDLVAYSSVNYPEPGGSTPPGYETINFGGQPAGTYMINVKVDYKGTRGNTSYYLEVANSGVRLCQ